ncbi:MAG: RrF2 family transcriptional regulator [Kiritimatiellia bacterium]|jgi:Rrf2 family cysteine metabolism transcriptional repressor
MISSSCQYALKAMLELSLRYQQGPISIGQIAESQKIPARFLEAILRQLKQAGLADSARGKDGGYFLAHPPHEISVGQVIKVIEGPLLAIRDNTSTDELPDVFSSVWNQASLALSRVLDQTRFDTLVDEELNRAYVAATNFSI